MKIRSATILATLLVAGLAVQVVAQKYAGKMGVEAGGDAFVDIVKTSYRWAKPDGSLGTLDPLNKKDGWPWEYVIDLCNQTNMDMWINIPVSVDDDYIRQLATLIKNNLKTSLKLLVCVHADRIGKVLLRVYNARGEVVLSQLAAVHAGVNELSIPPHTRAAGIYFVQNDVRGRQHV